MVRCLTLADLLHAKGWESVFFCRNHKGNSSSLIRDHGYQVILMDLVQGAWSGGVDHEAWVGDSQCGDAREVIANVKRLGLSADWLVVDHYGLDFRWERMLGEIFHNILVVDDLADRPHDCDILLDQNLPIDPVGRYEKLLPKSTQVLLGPRYALLNPAYALTRTRVRKQAGKVKNVLISLGGTDPGNLTAAVIDSILAVSDHHGYGCIHLNVVIGPGFSGWAKKRQKYFYYKSITFHENVKILAFLMADADLMVGTAGTTTWERMTLNLPSITLVVAKNQRENGQALRHWNYAKVMECLDGFDVEKFRDLFWSLLSGEEKLAESPPEVDGLGCSRILDLMLSVGIRLRKVTSLDADVLYRWSNEPGVRKASLNPDPIPYKTHLDWLEKKLASPETCVFLIGEDLSGCPVGTARFDETGDGWNVNYSVDGNFRGRGWGGKLLRKALDYLKAERNVGLLRAQVKADNLGSRKIIKSLGFVEGAAPGDCLEYWLETGGKKDV